MATKELPHEDTCGATCALCCQTQIDLGAYVLTGATQGERWDELVPRLIQKGWAVRRGPRGGREVICPACQSTIEQRMVVDLPLFDQAQACPKCQAHPVKAIHCTGRAQDCNFGAYRDHMHRCCEACGFAWITRCADENQSLWKRPWNLLRRRK